MRHILLAVCCSLALAAQTSVAPFKNLTFREIGPATMGGRIGDFAVVESNPNIAYVATASAGVFKTVNGGITWTPVFDDQKVSTIGDVSVAPSEPDTVWVGTGEANNRQSSSWGNGICKSGDGGKTWAHMGLKDTHHIARIAIHPSNPNVLYVAAAGHLWDANPERGVFKSTDGGKTRQKSLFINADTGVTDIAMDPQNPDTVYAAAYQRRRMSPDLTTNVDRKTLEIMGRKVEDRTMLSRHDGVGDFPTITSLAESSVRAGIVWAGTDDGLLHVSKDRETWTSITEKVPGLPKGTYGSRILPSAHAEGTAYAAFDGHCTGDFGIYLYRTTDFGQNPTVH